MGGPRAVGAKFIETFLQVEAGRRQKSFCLDSDQALVVPSPMRRMWQKAALVSLRALCIYLYSTCQTEGLWRAGEGLPSVYPSGSTMPTVQQLWEPLHSKQEQSAFAFVRYANTEEYMCSSINARRLATLEQRQLLM